MGRFGFGRYEKNNDPVVRSRASGLEERMMDAQSHNQMREDLKGLQACLFMATPVLLSDPAQLPTQIHGRLLAISPTRAEAMAQAVNRHRRSWLRMTFPTLGAPGSALKCTFHHVDDVMVVAICDDGSRAASGSLDGIVRVWDLKKASAIIETNADMGKPALAFSADGTRVAFNDEESETVVIFDVDQAVPVVGYPEEAHRLALKDKGRRLLWTTGDGMYSRIVGGAAKEVVLKQPGIFSFSTSEEVRFIATAQTKKSYADEYEEVIGRGSSRYVVGLLDRKEGLTATLADDLRVSCVAVNENGSIVLVGDEDGSIAAFSGRSKKKVAVLKGHTDEIVAIAISADGLRAVSGSRDSTLCIWDLGTWAERAVIPLPAIVQAVDLTPDGNTAISGCSDGTVQVWDVNAAISHAGSDLARKDRVRCVRFGGQGSKAGVYWQGDTIS